MRDPNILSVSQAALLAGVERHEFAYWLKTQPEFAAAIVINLPAKTTRISRLRLLRHLHGDDWQAVLGEAS